MAGKILVLGATGHVGSRLVQQLVAAGEKVKAASRGGAAVNGAEGVAFDYLDTNTYDAAFAGVDRLYLLVPTGYTNITDITFPVLDYAGSKGIKVVLQTAIGVDANDSIPYRQVELKLIGLGVPYVILRPNWFTDNFDFFWAEGIRQGVMKIPAGNGATSFIDVRDIAASAAAALTSAKFDNTAYNLTGPEAFNYAQAAELFSKALAKEVTYEAISDDEFIAMMTAAGVPEDYATFLASIFYPVREGWTAGVTPDVETLTGAAPRRLPDYIAENVGIWK